MQRIFKFWFICILVLALIASIIVGVESIIFGLVLLPLIIFLVILIILGYLKK